MADELQMRFEANTIEHLGVKMYSHIPNAIAELIANAYDADATEVQVKLYDTDEKELRFGIMVMVWILMRLMINFCGLVGIVVKIRIMRP